MPRSFYIKGSHLPLVLSLLSTLVPPPGHAQFAQRNITEEHGKKTITAIRTEMPIVVDGSLDEPAWQQAPVSSGFVQREPQEGEPASEKTEFHILYDTTTLYIGVLCYDSVPGAILATKQQRDDRLESDDTLTIVLDTFHDHRNAFLFRTNPLGTQYDALITDEGTNEARSTNEGNIVTLSTDESNDEGKNAGGSNTNESWDEKWDVASQVSSAGWTAEFAIPFKSLRMNEKGAPSWGLDLERVIRRKNELVYWNSFERGFHLEHVSQGGHLEGLKDIKPGMRLRVKPFVVGGFSQSSDASASQFRNASDFGMEVLKYRITPSLTADLTWNTDFAQGEIDRLKVDLSRFPEFFPEKREFFQEGAGIFEFGSAKRGSTRELLLFHSRRIGLSSSRRATVPITAGGRITGKLQGFTLGMLNVQSESLPSEGIPASNYAVLRVKRDVLSRSTVGAFLLNREKAGSDDFNRVYGVDGKLAIRKHFTMEAFLAKSTQSARVKDNWVASGDAQWNSDFLLVGMEYLSLQPNFRNDLGYIRRSNIRRFTPSLAFRPRPTIPWVRQMEISGRWDYVLNQKNRLVERIDEYAFQLTFQSGDVLRIVPLQHLFDRVEKPSAIKGIRIPAGDYAWNRYSAKFQGFRKRKLAGSVSFTHSYGYYKGNLYEWGISPVLQLNKKISIDADYKISDLTLPSGSSTSHTIDGGFSYTFNKQWLTNTILQYDSGNSFVRIHSRLNYIFRPDDDFFLIYSESRYVGGAQQGLQDRTVQAKVTYSFDF